MIVCTDSDVLVLHGLPAAVPCFHRTPTKNDGVLSKAQVLRLRHALVSIQLVGSEGFTDGVAMPGDVVDTLLRCEFRVISRWLLVLMRHALSVKSTSSVSHLSKYMDLLHEVFSGWVVPVDHFTKPSSPPYTMIGQTVCRRRSPSGLLGLRIQE